jgi:hypothetical protein
VAVAEPKVAVTAAAAVTVTLQLAAPVHAPDQPVKALLVPGVSVRVTLVFCGKLAEHVVGQLIPAGLLVIVPVPVPAIVTAIVKSFEPGGTGLSPTQPANMRVDKAHNNKVNQDVSLDFMASAPHRDRFWMRGRGGGLPFIAHANPF